MDKTEPLLELDYTPKNKSKRFFTACITYITLILFFNLFSSYENPTLRINNELVDYNSFVFHSSVKTKVTLLSYDLLCDSVQNVDHFINDLLVKFYTDRNYNPAWIQNFKTNNQFAILLNLLDSASYWGFPSDYFNTEKIHLLNNELKNTTEEEFPATKKAELELATTFSALKFMLYLEHGIIEKDSSLAYLSYIESLPKKLNEAIIHCKLRNTILSVQPNLVNHKNLLQSLSHFIDLHYSFKYTTPAFIDDKVLAKSLYYTGITESPVFDSINPKAEALYKLEELYGLAKDSVLNSPSHQILVSLLKYRYLQACLNLNRLRSLKHSGENYLFVNIPEFKLHVIEANQEKEDFNVIVGKKKTPTPILSSNIEKVIANPYWTVPRSIVNNEMLKKIRRDSMYLKRHGYFVINNYEEVVDESEIDWNSDDPLGNKYWIRQINSKHNALGQVKFIFPNNYSVYLHDTPSKTLFKRKNRTFSHGCIRIENPGKLAQYLTDKYNSQKESIGHLINTNEREVIDLTKKIEIYIQYITCSGTANSDMVFFNDVYNLDRKEIKAIFPDQFGI